MRLRGIFDLRGADGFLLEILKVNVQVLQTR